MPDNPVQEKPQFSIIIPSYNAALTLKDAVGSILCQTYKWFEVVIVDDGSTDNSFAVIEALVKKDGRVRHLSMKRNSGAPAAMNYGIKNASYDWIVIADSDAKAPTNWLQIATAVIKVYPDAGIFGGYTEYPQPRLDASYLQHLYYYCESILAPRHDVCFDRSSHGEPNIAGHNLFFKKEIIEIIGPFEESIRAGYDRLFLFQAKEMGMKIVYSKDLCIKHPLYDYEGIARFFARSITFARWRNVIFKMHKTEFERIFRNAAIMFWLLICTSIAAAVLLPLSIFLWVVAIGSLFFYGLMVMLAWRYMPINYAFCYPLLDVVKKLCTIMVYSFGLKPVRTDWKKR